MQPVRTKGRSSLARAAAAAAAAALSSSSGGAGGGAADGSSAYDDPLAAESESSYAALLEGDGSALPHAGAGGLAEASGDNLDAQLAELKKVVSGISMIVWPQRYPRLHKTTVRRRRR